MGVQHSTDSLDAPVVLATLLDEFSAITDYRTLRDSLPRRLASLLRCRCVLLYQRVGETLQFASGSFADQPGWSSALLAVAHINPIQLSGDVPEAQAWRARRPVSTSLAPSEQALVCAPLIYRQRAIGVLTAMRGIQTSEEQEPGWRPEEIPLIAVAANIAAMLLENTRLLERDRERIHELSLLNGITGQMNCSLREQARVQHVVVQRAKEIAMPDLCELLMPDAAPEMSAWLPPQLQHLLWQRWQNDLHATPLVLERASTRQAGEYMAHLEPRIKTFFALPLIGKHGGKAARGNPPLAAPVQRSGADAGDRVLGVLAGAYHKPWKLRREELVLLQILVNQASAVLENIGLVNDVVEARNEARRLLRQVLDDQRLKELILESIPSGLITVDLRGRVTTFNRAAESVLGYHPREVMGQPALKVLDLTSLERVLQSGQPQHETLLTSGRQGQEIALDVTLVPLLDDRGRQMGALTTFADITTMYRLQEEKRRLDRLASLGEMSASVAHEVRNPLAAIKTSMQMLLDDLESNHALQEDTSARDEIAIVLKEVERLDRIVRDLLLFSRPRQLHLVASDLGELSERTLHFLQAQCDERGVRVRLLRQDLPVVHIDVAQMEQVLLNLFLNALHAMPDGGILSVSFQVVQTPASVNDTGPRSTAPIAGQLPAHAASFTEEQPEFPQDDEQLGMDETQNQQKWLEMVVSDTGVGIAQDALERIFQPFYTTRAHGIGLGLPITRRLIEDHRGYILVESQLGYGTTVSVRLPLREKDVVERGAKRCESDDPDY